MSLLYSFSVRAECSMNSPETTLKCFEKYYNNKDANSLEKIYWGPARFHFPNLVSEESAYKIIERKKYKDDLNVDMNNGKFPIWAKKGNIELVCEKYIDGEIGIYSHIFRKIDGKMVHGWLLWAHSR